VGGAGRLLMVIFAAPALGLATPAPPMVADV
jgi:hypothetical protein